MVLDGRSIFSYTLSGEKKHHEIKVQLKQVDGLIEKYQNIYKGSALVDEVKFDHPDLKNCVNAQHMADAIADEMITKLRTEHGKKFRLKHNKKKK